jgi:signal transduction histidine kinase
MIPVNPAAATALAVVCRESSALALAELRDLVRGIYPPVLAERGLGDAVRALALDSPVNVATEVDLPGRPPAPVEAATYFAVAEALSNVAKHADARRALVRVYHRDGMLRTEVTDDGNGGADPAHGTGLAGIERRLGAFDGILAVSSPVGGPTIVVIEVPCELSWPKISTC